MFLTHGHLQPFLNPNHHCLPGRGSHRWGRAHLGSRCAWIRGRSEWRGLVPSPRPTRALPGGVGLTRTAPSPSRQPPGGHPTWRPAAAGQTGYGTSTGRARLRTPGFCRDTLSQLDVCVGPSSTAGRGAAGFGAGRTPVGRGDGSTPEPLSGRVAGQAAVDCTGPLPAPRGPRIHRGCSPALRLLHGDTVLGRPLRGRHGPGGGHAEGPGQACWDKRRKHSRGAAGAPGRARPASARSRCAFSRRGPTRSCWPSSTTPTRS